MAAVSQVTVEYRWISSQDHCCFTIKGDTPARLVIQDALSHALDTSALAVLRRQVTCQHSADGIKCLSVPQGHQGVAPEGAFLLGLAIGLSRMLLNQCISESNCLIRIKWDSRILWQDKVHPTTSIGFLLSVLGFGLSPYTLGSKFHFVCKGQRCLPEQLVSDFAVSSHCGAIVFHLVPFLHGGGPGSKNQQRMLQQTALASVLLEHGYDLPWTTKTCDTLLAKFSLHRIQAITAQPMGSEKLKAILQICKEADIVLPEVNKPSSRVAATSAPWANAKKTKRAQVQLDPKDYLICPGFFLNEDGSQVTQLQELRPQASGIVLASSQQAQSWIREGQLISSDELGLLILAEFLKLPFHSLKSPSHAKTRMTRWFFLLPSSFNLVRSTLDFLKVLKRRLTLNHAPFWPSLCLKKIGIKTVGMKLCTIPSRFFVES